MKDWLYYNGDYIAQILICTATWNGFVCCVGLYICYRNTTLSDRIIINCIGVYINE